MIELTGLCKRYGNHVAVSDISFEARPGRVTGLLGPNGAGKSTTMRLLLGLDRPDAGQGLVNGVPYQKLKRPLLTCGSQFDGSGAHKGRTARAHLRWVAISNGIHKDRISEVLDIVGLRSVESKRVGTFSLGMGQRLGIATALLGDPDVLILDEPTNGLDPEGIRWVRELLLSLANAGKTVLVSSHLMGEMQAIAHDLVVIAQGRVVKTGSTSELIGKHGNLEEAYFDWTENRAQYAAGSSSEG